MINFRFHLVSLIAVFLALALGVVMGYGVLGQPTVDTLQDRVNSVEVRANQIRAENDRLRGELSRLETAFSEIDDFAVTSRLDDATVVPVAVRGVDAGKVVETVQLARNPGGAVVPGILWLEEKWALDASDEDAPAELAAIVGASPTDTRANIRAQAARALANRLASGPTSARTDVLAALDDAGYVSFQDVDGIDFDSTRLDGRPASVLIVGGNAAAVRADRSVVPLTQELIDLGRPVVVADEWHDADHGPQRGEQLSVIRDGELSTLVSTVDSFDTLEGPLVTVLVVADRGQGAIGHYGFGAGAGRRVPAWSIL